MGDSYLNGQCLLILKYNFTQRGTPRFLTHKNVGCLGRDIQVHLFFGKHPLNVPN